MSEENHAPEPGARLARKPSLWTLFLITLKISAFTFGGGYAMFPIITKEFVENRPWMNEKDMTDTLAVAQTIPGIISVNAIVMIGYKTMGIAGALVGTLGLTLPCFVILAVVTLFYRWVQENAIVQAALGGVRVAVVALLIQAVVKLFKTSFAGGWTYLLGAAALAAGVFLDINPIFIILGGAVVGLIRTAVLWHKRKGVKP